MRTLLPLPLLLLGCPEPGPLPDPVAVCSASSLEVPVGTTVTVDSAGSTGVDDEDALRFLWTIALAPQTSVVTFPGGATGPTASFLVDVPGEYLVELRVTSETGATDSCDLTVVATGDHAFIAPTAPVEVQLTWDVAGDDLDLHVLLEGGAWESEDDCHYGNCTAAVGGPLDWGTPDDPADDALMLGDDIPGTGPEIVQVAGIVDQAYEIVVHDFPDDVEETTEATVKLFVDGVLLQEWVFRISEEDSMTTVATFNPETGEITEP